VIVTEETIRTLNKDLTAILNGLNCKSRKEDGSFEAC
jgi:hypothetical protein